MYQQVENQGYEGREGRQEQSEGSLEPVGGGEGRESHQEHGEGDEACKEQVEQVGMLKREQYNLLVPPLLVCVEGK